MKKVFVDTSGFYAFLDRDDGFHAEATRLFLSARDERWHLLTSNYVVHETWALVQARLGWDAVEDVVRVLVPLCEVKWVDDRLHALGAARCRQARERRLSLTDAVSFEVMIAADCWEFLGDDEHFLRAGFRKASP